MHRSPPPVSAQPTRPTATRKSTRSPRTPRACDQQSTPGGPRAATESTLHVCTCQRAIQCTERAITAHRHQPANHNTHKQHHTRLTRRNASNKTGQTDHGPVVPQNRFAMECGRSPTTKSLSVPQDARPIDDRCRTSASLRPDQSKPPQLACRVVIEEISFIVILGPPFKHRRRETPRQRDMARRALCVDKHQCQPQCSK